MLLGKEPKAQTEIVKKQKTRQYKAYELDKHEYKQNEKENPELSKYKRSDLINESTTANIVFMNIIILKIQDLMI